MIFKAFVLSVLTGHFSDQNPIIISSRLLTIHERYIFLMFSNPSAWADGVLFSCSLHAVH